MMELVREWLLGITGAAILAAGADALMPNGGVKRVGKLLCSLVLLSAVLSPFLDWYGGGAEYVAVNYGAYVSQLTGELEKGRSEQMKPLIEEGLRAYSMDKMEREGLPGEVWVECGLSEDGVYLPVLVSVEGELGEEEKSAVLRLLASELGVDSAGFVFRKGGNG